MWHHPSTLDRFPSALLPVLVGTEIVGHVDPKADRTARKLIVVSRRIQRGHTLAPATRAFAQWLGLK